MIIGINGFKGSGKNVVGDYLERRYGFVQMAFADKLKESAAMLFGIEPALWDELKNEPGAFVTLTGARGVCGKVTVREFLQLYGTEAHRDIFDEDFWVDALFRGGDWDHIVITDARFTNELLAIRARGGLNLQVVRPPYGMGSYDAHRSEAQPDPRLIDRTITNIGTFEHLYALVDEWMASRYDG